LAKLKLTKSSVEAVPFAEGRQKVYFDTQMTGFGLCVGQRTKSYFAQRQVGRKTIRVTIGRHGVFTTEQARSEARQLLARLARGEDPRRERREIEARSLTLEAALASYLQAKNLRPFTERTYQRAVRLYLADWRTMPLAEITPEMVSRRHRALGEERGQPTANGTMRILRTIYNYSSVIHEDLPPNPVMRLTKTRTWFRERRRNSVIRSSDLPRWFSAVMETESATARDYLRLLLLTGMRRSEGLRLRWENVDLGGSTLMVPDTKNYEPLVLPLSDYLLALLSQRRNTTEESEWVFPAVSARGHFQEPKKFIWSVREKSGVSFTLHDLRRTFITIAESLDISTYALKRLLNHKLQGDVTAGYIISDVERLRAPMQRITDSILERAKFERSDF